jgi:hypothetical protein
MVPSDMNPAQRDLLWVYIYIYIYIYILICIFIYIYIHHCNTYVIYIYIYISNYFRQSLPEHLVDDIVIILIFVSKVHPACLSTSPLDQVLNLVVFFLRRPWAVQSPHLRYVYIYICVYMYIFIFKHTYIHIYIHIFIYIYIYIHIYEYINICI